MTSHVADLVGVGAYLEECSGILDGSEFIREEIEMCCEVAFDQFIHSGLFEFQFACDHLPHLFLFLNKSS